MKKSYLAIGFIFLFCSTLPSYACEPCTKVLSFEESVKEADLIVIGKNITLESNSRKIGGPEWIEVEVREVLKGKIDANKIKVNSWDGMCGYGIVIDQSNDYVILLKKREIPNGEYQFDAVNFGCGVKEYVLKGNYVDMDGNEISLSEFKSKL